MSQRNHVVVWDPEGKYWEGSLVGPEVATLIRGRGGAALPTDPELFAVSGVGGYMRRGWGAGWPLDAMAPRSFCPLALYVTPEHRALHWAARLVADEGHLAAARERGIDHPGSIQIMSYSPRSNTFKVSITPRTEVVKIAGLGKADDLGGWTIGGHAVAHPAMEGVAAFALYGSGAGVRVAWAALSAVKG